ncbi:MAG: hypothetical protein LBT09_07600 [Planctomycetaceae bacterium]|nr:hypothetical protein [Planctomycetaceae bacterium]
MKIIIDNRFLLAWLLSLTIVTIALVNYIFSSHKNITTITAQRINSGD